GYHTCIAATCDHPGGVSEAAQGKYIPRLLMEQLRGGIVRTYIYELFDEAAETSTNHHQHFGLVRFDGSFKPAAVAVENLLALMRDPGSTPVPAGGLNLTLTGPATVHQLLFKKSNGHFWLALWNDVLSFNQTTNTDIANAAVNVSIAITTTTVTHARRYQPSK